MILPNRVDPLLNIVLEKHTWIGLGLILSGGTDVLLLPAERLTCLRLKLRICHFVDIQSSVTVLNHQSWMFSIVRRCLTALLAPGLANFLLSLYLFLFHFVIIVRFTWT
jgi:hypothetical protein